MSAAALAVALLGATPVGHAALGVVKFAEKAGEAKHAKTADVATKAKKADTAGKAKKAASADEAKHAKSADIAASATKAAAADEATHSKSADVAADAQKLAGHEVGETQGKLVPLDANSKLPKAVVDLSDVYTKQQADVQFLASGARGVALAGVDFTGADGSVNQWFNRLGGKPTVSRTSAGRYTVTFPGLSLSINFQIVHAALVGSDADAFISVNSVSGNLLVVVKNAAGNDVDRRVSLVVYDASSTG